MPVTNNPLSLKFYNNVIDDFLLYAVIITKYKDKWVFCKHKKRNTYEVPGGKREKGESILDTAKRELYEETGATKYSIHSFSPYSVKELGIESFGMIFYAAIDTFDTLPDSEMEKIILLDILPPIEDWTYPSLQPKMIEKYLELTSHGI